MIDNDHQYLNANDQIDDSIEEIPSNTNYV